LLVDSSQKEEVVNLINRPGCAGILAFAMSLSAAPSVHAAKVVKFSKMAEAHIKRTAQAAQIDGFVALEAQRSGLTFFWGEGHALIIPNLALLTEHFKEVSKGRSGAFVGLSTVENLSGARSELITSGTRRGPFALQTVATVDGVSGVAATTTLRSQLQLLIGQHAIPLGRKQTQVGTVAQMKRNSLLGPLAGK
jgi:hypothetical protein